MADRWVAGITLAVALAVIAYGTWLVLGQP